MTSRPAQAVTDVASTCLRVNAPGTPWHHDDLAAVAEQLSSVPVIALVETARGLLEALRLSEVPGATRPAFGSIDFSHDIAAAQEQLALLHARSTLVVASRAGGLTPPVDGVTTALDDDHLLLRGARHAATMGFGAKLRVHPRQVAAVNDTFSPRSGAGGLGHEGAQRLPRRRGGRRRGPDDRPAGPGEGTRRDRAARGTEPLRVSLSRRIWCCH